MTSWFARIAGDIIHPHNAEIADIEQQLLDDLKTALEPVIAKYGQHIIEAAVGGVHTGTTTLKAADEPTAVPWAPADTPAPASVEAAAEQPANDPPKETT